MTEFKGYKKGVDFGGWLSQCVHTKEHYDTFISEEDVKTAASWGIDHIRLPIDYNLLEDENGTPTDHGCGYIDNAVKWCKAAGLNIILDLHKTAGYSFDKGEGEFGFFDSEPLQERFMKLWDRIAERYAVSDGTIAFELLNEVSPPVSGLGAVLSGDHGNGDLSAVGCGSCGCGGCLSGRSLGCCGSGAAAAGCQRQGHSQNQQQRNNLLHLMSSIVELVCNHSAAHW